MTFLQFKSLSPYKQFEILAQKGVMIGDRISIAYKFILYQLDSFYVEVKSNLFDKKIEAIKCFFDTKNLEPYLDDISLPEL
jgi:hypothetical protein